MSKNIISIATAADPRDLWCIQIGEEVVEKCEGDLRGAITDQRHYAAEIILAAILVAFENGEAYAAIQKKVVTMAVAFEEASAP